MNRRNNPNTNCDGVDVNCNCDFMFRVIGPATSLAIRVLRWNRLPAACHFQSPKRSIFACFSDTQRIDFFIDLHSFSELVLLLWGHAPTQTTQPLPNFTDLQCDAS
jgi:hypothetical protein